MKLITGLLTLGVALIISAVAGYFSVIGLGHLFAGAFWPAVIMASALEAGKLVAASWLKANWRNENVSRIHKWYLVAATVILMMITALGIYGYLAKGHLEQEAPLASVELKIAEIDTRITQVKADRTRLEQRQGQLDHAIATLLENAKTSKDAQSADRARQSQKKDRAEIQKQIKSSNDELNTLGAALVPLKLQVSDVSSKLGPVKYVANLFGWTDTNTAVQMVILLIMFVFDPLAIVLILSGAITLGEYMKDREVQDDQQVRNTEIATLSALVEEFDRKGNIAAIDAEMEIISRSGGDRMDEGFEHRDPDEGSRRSGRRRYRYTSGREGGPDTPSTSSEEPGSPVVPIEAPAPNSTPSPQPPITDGFSAYAETRLSNTTK